MVNFGEEFAGFVEQRAVGEGEPPDVKRAASWLLDEVCILPPSVATDEVKYWVMGDVEENPSQLEPYYVLELRRRHNTRLEIFGESGNFHIWDNGDEPIYAGDQAKGIAISVVAEIERLEKAGKITLAIATASDT